MSFTKFPIQTREIDADNLVFFQDVRQTQYLVSSIDDLPEPVNGVITLPADTMVEPDGMVDIGTNQLQLSSNTSIVGRDPAKDGFITNRPGDYAIVGSDGGGQRVFRTFFVVNNGGYAFDIETTEDIHINLFYIGVLGQTGFGRFSGGRVIAIKSCYQGELTIPGVGTFAPLAGAVIDGTLDKLLVGDSPFEDMDSGFVAITVKSTAVLEAVDIRGNYFKGTGGTAIEVEAGATINRGIISANVIEPDITPSVGFDQTTPQWKWSGNTNVADSYIIGKMRYDQSNGGVVTAIAAQSTPVKVNITTLPSSMNQRFTHTDNRLAFNGEDPVVVSMTSTFYLTSSGNNEEVTVYLAKNGNILPADSSTVFVGTGGDRTVGTVIGVEELNKGDYIEVFVANDTSTGDITFFELNTLIQG